MVMASAFVKSAHSAFPDAQIDLIVKKELAGLVPLFAPKSNVYGFSKKEYAGFSGPHRFGKEIRKQKQYDLFFCLPDSLSSAMMARATGAVQRIGFSKGINGIFFSKTLSRKKNVHRAEEYLGLLHHYLTATGHEIARLPSPLSPVIRIEDRDSFRRGAGGEGLAAPGRKSIIININSEASSRRLPAEKAVSLLNDIAAAIPNPLVLIGSPAECDHVESIRRQLNNPQRFENIAGKTSLVALADVFANAAAVLSTDSGPAHLANATGVPTVVLFGAGNEFHTAPYNKENRTIIRLGKLSCEPCENNVCKRYGTPQCLVQLDNRQIIRALQNAIEPTRHPSPVTRHHPASFETDITKCMQVLNGSGVILYPTDTIWGLGCDATNEAAVAKIFAIKKRTEAKSLIVFVRDFNEVSTYTDVSAARLKDIIDKIDRKDRATTIIYPGARNLSANVIAEDCSIGIRIPHHDFSKALLKAYGKPIVSTSANISGEFAPQCFADISNEIKNAVDYVVSIEREANGSATPSRILKLLPSGEFEIIRD